MPNIKYSFFIFGQCIQYINDCFSEQDIPFTFEILLDGWVMKSKPISFTIHIRLIYWLLSFNVVGCSCPTILTEN